MTSQTLTVNGQAEPLDGAETVTALLERLGLGASPRGVAVAVAGEVVPRTRWPEHALSAGDRVEVVRAVQGG